MNRRNYNIVDGKLVLIEGVKNKEDEMKKLYYCCLECRTIFACFQRGKQVKCSVCEVPCKYDGAPQSSFKPEQLSHGLCNPCYYRRQRKQAIADWEERILKGGKDEKQDNIFG